MSFFNRIDIGIRYLLMVYPLLIVLVSGVYPIIERNLRLNIAFLLLLGWYVVESMLIYPHYFAYFNELSGGPKYGYKYLSDSNLDWGQDNDAAKLYIAKHPGIIVNPEYPTTGMVIVNATTYAIGFGDDYWLKMLNKEPVDNVNYSWIIFNITEEDLKRL